MKIEKLIIYDKKFCKKYAYMIKYYNMLKRLLKIIIVLCVSCLFFSCASNVKTIEEQSAETRTYVLNTNSRRIHSENCGTGKSTKAKNKEVVSSDLNSLLEKGYKICGLCNAGLKEKGASFNVFKKLVENSVQNYDFELPSRDEYLDAIETMGEWYVKHIPTYQKELQEEEQFYTIQIVLRN